MDPSSLSCNVSKEIEIDTRDRVLFALFVGIQLAGTLIHCVGMEDIVAHLPVGDARSFSAVCCQRNELVCVG